MTEQVLLTTIDNPFNPFTDFENWFLFDVEKGYYSCNLLDRIAKTNDQMTDQEKERAYSEAIDQIIQYDFLNIYKKITNKQ